MIAKKDCDGDETQTKLSIKLETGESRQNNKMNCLLYSTLNEGYGRTRICIVFLGFL